MHLTLTLALLVSAPPPPPAAPSAPAKAFERERFGNHAIAQLWAEGFSQLSPADRLVAWHLTLAAHAGEPIAFDQTGWDNNRVRQLLEGVYLFGRDGKSGAFDQKLAEYLKRFYGHLGNHDSTTGQKFLPTFTAAELQAAAQRALKAGAPLGATDEAGLQRLLTELGPTLFDPNHEPQLTAKSPPPGQDLLTASSNTAYGREVTLKDLEGFSEKYPLNSRVVKQDGKLVEQVFRAGTPDGKVAKGLYAEQLQRVSSHLQAAMKHADKPQRQLLGKLVRYFQTGEPKDWDAYNIAWLKANPTVDANLGFIESYVDARGQKGQWEGLINLRDASENRIMELLAQRAQYFEDRMPWPAQYRRKKVSLPVAKAITLITAHATPPAGINLPNEQHIRQKHGSKSVMVANTMETAAAMKRLPLALEFSRTPEERELARQHAHTARKLLVAFHEVTGHASGQVDKKLKGDASKHLKEYDNTLEEARADLVALWHAFDPALEAWSPQYEEIARQMYRDFLVEGLTNLARVETGDSFEEDHQRGHHMTVGYLMEKGAVQQVVDGGKAYWVATDFPKMRAAVGELLGKLMVIKATGDYAGIQGLVEKHGIKFDPKLRDEVAARVKGAKVPTVTLMVSPRLVPKLDAKGQVVDVTVAHDQPLLEQHLERSVLSRVKPEEAGRVAATLGTLDGLRAAMRASAPGTKVTAQP